MATTKQFDLNGAVRSWRQSLNDSPAFQHENLDELEGHLRDSVAQLQTVGLSIEEAFVIGIKRIGGGACLESEYAKINGSAVWLDRLFWVLVAFHGWIVISSAIGIACVLLPVLASTKLLASVLPTLTFLVTAWLLFSKLGHWASRQLSPLRWSAGAFSVSLLVAVLLFQCLLYTAVFGLQDSNVYVYPHKDWGQMVLGELGAVIPGSLVLAVWTFFVARKRLRLVKDD